MSKKDSLYRLYKDSPVAGFNKQNTDNQWIKLVQEYKPKTIRLCNEEVAGLEPPFFMYPITIFGHFAGIGCRAIDGKEKRNIPAGSLLLYSSQKAIEKRKDHSIDKPIMLSEGPLDAEMLSHIYPHSMASLGIQPSKTTIKILSCIAERIIFVPDNDEQGQEAKEMMKFRCKKNGLRFTALDIPDSLSDPGDLIDGEDEAKQILSVKVASLID